MTSRSFALVAAVAASLVASAASAAAPAGCQLVKIGELPVQFDNNRPLIKAMINGQEGWFLADTGAFASLMFATAVAKLNLHTIDGGAEFYGVGGAREAKIVTIADLDIGGAKVKNFQMYAAGEQGGGKVFGVLGRDFFGKVDEEFDLAHNVIRLFKPVNCARQSLAYWSNEPEFVDMNREGGSGFAERQPVAIPVVINGARVNAILDSGAGMTILTPDAAHRAGASDKELDAAPASAVHGLGAKAVDMRSASFDTVQIGDEKINKVTLEVSDMFRTNDRSTGTRIRTSAFGELEMLLGADFLRSHRVYIANSQDRVYFTYTGGKPFGGRGPMEQSEPAAKP